MKFFAPISLNFGACRCDKHCKKKLKQILMTLMSKAIFMKQWQLGTSFSLLEQQQIQNSA